jgi:hypothetical protein
MVKDVQLGAHGIGEIGITGAAAATCGQGRQQCGRGEGARR